MIALTSQTAAAVALQAAEGSWVMFLQVMPPGVAGPIKIEAIHGKHIASRLNQITKDNAYDIQLIGLLESSNPNEDAQAIANEVAAYQIHDWWFEPNQQLLALIQEHAQDPLSIMLASMYAGALSEAPVDIDQIAKILNVSVPTIRRMIKAGEIPFLRIGRAYRFVPNDVLASLKR